MKRTIIAALVAASITSGSVGSAEAHHGDREWVPCEYEDSVGCVWDAKHMGNGSGQSFKVTKDGDYTYISHRKAKHLLGSNHDDLVS